MTDLDLSALRAKAEAATPGPWRVETDTTLVWGRCDPEDFTTYGMGIPLTEVHIGQQQLKGPSLSCDEAEATAQFIAAANPSVILALLDRVEKAEAEVQRQAFDLEACGPVIDTFKGEITRLHSLLARAGEALKPACSGDGWGTILAWVVNGASSNEAGVAAAKKIVAMQMRADAVAREIEEAMR